MYICWESENKILQVKNPQICELHFESRYKSVRKLFYDAVPSLKLNKYDSDEVLSSDYTENFYFSPEELNNLNSIYIDNTA